MLPESRIRSSKDKDRSYGKPRENLPISRGKNSQLGITGKSISTSANQWILPRGRQRPQDLFCVEKSNIAPSIPLSALPIVHIPLGKAARSGANLEYNGSDTSPLQPESTMLTISFASSTGSTTGARKVEGVLNPPNMVVPSCPGVTKTVLICSAP